jgi:hypothetical protein
MTHQKGTIRRVRASQEEESRIKAERRRKLLLVMSYDSLYHRAGTLLSASSAGIMVGITMEQAALCLSKMAEDFIIDMAKITIMTPSGGHKSNAYKLRPASQLSKRWRKHPNFRPMPSRYQLGAPI